MQQEQAYRQNQQAVSDFQPGLLWQWFARISAIPHPSYHEAALVAYIKRWALERGLLFLQDKVGNVIIKKPATPGMQDRAAIALQAHLDMVPQANEATKHDFTKDPIILRSCPEDGQWICATGTTLGADNGIGMASCLAVLDSDDLSHPDLEVLLTMTEETGMVGAIGLESGLLDAKIMVNTDTEEIGEVYVGCAGGIDADLSFTPNWQEADAFGDFDQAFCLTVKGLRGGHSGIDIHKNRGNAIKMLAGILPDAKKPPFVIANLKGGTLRNAIPREASLTLVCRSTQAKELCEAINQAYQDLKEQVAVAEPKLELQITQVDRPSKWVSHQDSQKICQFLKTLPSGVVRYSDVVDAVETSLSFGQVLLDEHKMSAKLLVRSLNEVGKRQICDQLQALADLAGFSATFGGNYAGWNPDQHSSITPIVVDLYAKLLGHSPKIKVIHAGLECGLIKQSYPALDIVSIGPTIKNAHSPDEKVHVPSVSVYWQLLVDILANAPKKA